MDGSTSKEKVRQVLLPEYRLSRTLGIGSSGKVKLAQHILTGKRVAIKIIKWQNLNDSEADKVRREIKLLRALSHPHIVRVYEVIERRFKFYIVMEYVSCGELFYYIMERGKLHEGEGRYIFQQIISGVSFCHLNKIVHRDLKPENLLLDSNHKVKIVDFGLGNFMHDGHFLKTSCGSPNYAAPEIVTGQLYAGPEVDVWSCGVILYVLLCGKLPFDDDLPRLCEKIKRGIYTHPCHLSSGARDLIGRILVTDPMARITINQMLNHPWLRDHICPSLSLCPSVSLPAEQVMQRAKKIDEGVLREVVKLGFNHNHVIESFQSGRQNEATVSYYLLLDNQLSVSNVYTGSVHEVLFEATSSSMSSTPYPGHYIDDNGSFKTFNSNNHMSWTLGIQSLAHPRYIMMGFLNALQKLNVCWKKIGCYNMKCGWLPRFPTYSFPLDLNTVPFAGGSGVAPMSEISVKFEMQLYKATEKSYVLDLQIVHGPAILFLEVCYAFFTQFVVPAS